jgi:hypothetical protein
VSGSDEIIILEFGITLVCCMLKCLYYICILWLTAHPVVTFWLDFGSMTCTLHVCIFGMWLSTVLINIDFCLFYNCSVKALWRSMRRIFCDCLGQMRTILISSFVLVRQNCVPIWSQIWMTMSSRTGMNCDDVWKPRHLIQLGHSVVYGYKYCFYWSVNTQH